MSTNRNILAVTLTDLQTNKTKTIEELFTSEESSLTEILTLRSTTTQAVPIHDTTPATEIVIDFGSGGDDAVSVDSSGIEILKDLESMIVLQELHIEKTGSGAASEFTFWAEASVDGGTTWIPYPDSLRRRTVDKDGSGTITTDFSVSDPLLTGMKFRIVCTNTAAGVLSLEAPATLTSSNGNVTGYTKKVTLLHK